MLRLGRRVVLLAHQLQLCKLSLRLRRRGSWRAAAFSTRLLRREGLGGCSFLTALGSGPASTTLAPQARQLLRPARLQGLHVSHHLWARAAFGLAPLGALAKEYACGGAPAKKSRRFWGLCRPQLLPQLEHAGLHVTSTSPLPGIPRHIYFELAPQAGWCWARAASKMPALDLLRWVLAALRSARGAAETRLSPARLRVLPAGLQPPCALLALPGRVWVGRPRRARLRRLG